MMNPLDDLKLIVFIMGLGLAVIGFVSIFEPIDRGVVLICLKIIGVCAVIAIYILAPLLDWWMSQK